MPSEYGWTCLGGARKEAEPCSINYGRDVSWWENTPYDNPTLARIDECKSEKQMSDKGKKCCHILLVNSENGFADCSQFKNDIPISDQCSSKLAMKLNQANLCNPLQNSNARKICIFHMRYK